ncbi:2,3-bisphosphoglycerate-independent phosphoglycerate mutase [Thiotrichales bacterium 19S3-7]|nr:2,3-bisphosphoglycerate-independent phosphoglycerate mutase [Thiotrichales bacterium 19S3-7]MCF6801527.1 2,3-bisphosphoglycerate-independent phosphoglycerate mutase [Thiotrichales bacterium 19S3-11]
MILDGWGYRKENQDNAINQANTPNWDRLWQTNVHTLLDASGEVVGLPKGQMGNSEVGHVTIGAGRVIYQELARINKDIQSHDFYQNSTLNAAVEHATAKGKAVHILGLLSPGGVHSHENHILEMIRLAYRKGAQKIYLHAFLDGRDTPPKSALNSLKKADALFDELEAGHVASICGRYYAMDRDKRWDRVEQAYDLLTLGKSDYSASSSTEALEKAYLRGESDEFVKPTTINPNGHPVKIQDGDSVIFMNFRSDRARELSYALSDANFDGFKRQAVPTIRLTTLTQYADDIDSDIAYPPSMIHNSLGEYLSEYGMKQLRIAETEKYAHVTFFFNGGVEKTFPGEDRILIPSPKVATYDLQPEMSAYEVTDQLVNAINSGNYDVIICNYANADMVGHTGKMDAAIKACEALDQCIGLVDAAIAAQGGEMIITADHGNADIMKNEQTQMAHTAHTTSLVPALLVSQFRSFEPVISDGRLSDIAPTILSLISMEIPKEMTGRVLFKQKTEIK